MNLDDLTFHIGLNVHQEGYYHNNNSYDKDNNGNGNNFECPFHFCNQNVSSPHPYRLHEKHEKRSYLHTEY